MLLTGLIDKEVLISTANWSYRGGEDSLHASSLDGAPEKIALTLQSPKKQDGVTVTKRQDLVDLLAGSPGNSINHVSL